MMQRLHGIAGQELASSMLARSPTVQGLAETLAAIPPVNPQQQDAISHAPFTPAQRAAGVPCAAMQESAARSYLVRALLELLPAVTAVTWQFPAESGVPSTASAITAIVGYMHADTGKVPLAAGSILC